MDFKDIIKNVDIYKANNLKRGKNPEDIDDICYLYQERVKIDFAIDMTKRFRNLIGPEIAKLAKLKKNLAKQNLSKDELDTKLNEGRQSNYNNDVLENIKVQISTKETFPEAVKYLSQLPMSGLAPLAVAIKDLIQTQTTQLKEITDTLNSKVSKLGNKLHPDVPEETDFVLENGSGEPPKVKNILGHYELCQKTGIVNFPDGINIMGNRGYFLTGLGVKLNRAIISYALDFLDNHNYNLIETPHMMTTEALDGVSQLEDFEETLYKCGDKYLIATAEQPITAMHRDKVLKSKEMPIKLGGVSHCYRKEAGSQGKDTLGIFRVHQFEKVEQFCITSPDKSWEMMDQMIKIAKQFYISLGLRYQIVNINAVDLNNAASMKYDLECYFPGAKKKYKELVSCTNCTDYISRKLHVKNDKGEYVHMLNSTLCANTRTICCLLETHQTDTGIIIPEALRPYMNNVEFIPFVNNN